VNSLIPPKNKQFVIFQSLKLRVIIVCCHEIHMFSQDAVPPTQDGLEAAIEEIGGKGKWVWIMFFLVSTPGIFNIWHLTAYVFLGQALPYWCAVPELQAANWTSEQIRNISSPG
jgi:hypothetical protein